MKSYYIYLVEIYHPKGPYYYVGSHTWDGPEGVVDPGYFGSCRYGSQFGMIRWGDHTSVGKLYYDWCHTYGYQMSILQVCTKETVSDAEKYWIEAYLTKYGAKLRDTPGKKHLSKFSYGTCLNGYVSSHEVLHDPDVVARRNSTRTRLGHWNHEHLHTPEAVQRAIDTKKARGYKPDDSCLHTPEAVQRLVQTRKANGSYLRSNDACKRQSDTMKRNARKIICSSPEGQEFACCSSQMKDLFPSNTSAPGIISRMYSGKLPSPYTPTSASNLHGWSFRLP